VSTRVPFFGQPIRRNEDARLLTGGALFVDDVQLPGMLHAAFVRSPLAHARIRGVDTRSALRRAGVAGVFAAADLGDYWQLGPLLVNPPPIEGLTFHARTQPTLARDKVRFVGEPIAIVVAESRYLAEDAAEEVFVDYDPLDPVVDLERALNHNAGLIHEDLRSNLAAHVPQHKGDYNAARANAAVVVARRFRFERGASAAIEPRAIVAHWQARQRELTVWDTTQAPIPIRNGLASRLGLSESQVRVVAPFIGGGFGPKIMMFYQDELLIPWLSMRLGRPVKWTEDRSESFFATSQEREQIHTSEMALNADGRILGVRDRFLHDTGAYDPYGLTVPINSQCTLLGPYVVPNYDSEFSVVFTNKPIVTPVRGAGRQQGVFVMERLLDLAARELGISALQIRRRNLIAPEDFPHDHQILYQDFAPLVYDSGNYRAALDRAAEMIGFDRFLEEEQPRLRAEGKHVGVGIVSYVEGSGIGPYEGARVTVEANGKVTVATGVGTQGQGHFTSFAQIVADQVGVAVSDVRVVTGDTGDFNWGTGTFASRGAVVAGNACHAAALAVRKKILQLAAQIFEVIPEQIDLANGQVGVHGSPERSMSLAELAKRANPLRGAVQPGTEPGLEATEYFGPARGCTANGVHAIILEIDAQTAMIEIKRFVVVHDCGNVINPLIVEGQIHGGVAHGIGNSFYEKLVYDDNGQLLTASFMDYLLPTALEVPTIETDHIETPSPLNPLGVKGVGEAGAIPVPALYAQAIENAFDQRLEVLEMPLSPAQLFALLRSAGLIPGQSH
jgi:aerobic carbon-monoxide dehydrogenase large subunit